MTAYVLEFSHPDHLAVTADFYSFDFMCYMYAAALEAGFGVQLVEVQQFDGE